MLAEFGSPQLHKPSTNMQDKALTSHKNNEEDSLCAIALQFIFLLNIVSKFTPY